jgi:hypothetical protein
MDIPYTMEYYSTIKTKEILSFATKWMNLDDIMLNEISQAEKDKSTVTHSSVESKNLTS